MSSSVLPAELISDAQSVFTALCGSSSALDINTVQSALAYCGARYTALETREILQRLTGSKQDVSAIDFQTFLDLLQMTLSDCSQEDEIRASYAVMASRMDPLVAKEADVDGDGSVTMADFEKVVSM
jgi:Ca2+-binding EF-hand superfamily protein